MTDLIRRTDAMREMWKHANGKTVLGGQTYQSLTLEVALDAIAALPAVTVGVPEVEERKFYHDAWPLTQLLKARDLGDGLLTDDGEAWRYRLSHSDARGRYDVLYRHTRIIAALEPTPVDDSQPTDPAVNALDPAALRVTGPNSDGEYWLHIKADGRSGGINLGDQHGSICKRLLDAVSETGAKK